MACEFPDTPDYQICGLSHGPAIEMSTMKYCSSADASEFGFKRNARVLLPIVAGGGRRARRAISTSLSRFFIERTIDPRIARARDVSPLTLRASPRGLRVTVIYKITVARNTQTPRRSRQARGRVARTPKRTAVKSILYPPPLSFPGNIFDFRARSTRN